MTQEELSERVDIDIRQLARIEAGVSFATSETIEKLCMALNVTYKDLFDFKTQEANMTDDNISCAISVRKEEFIRKVKINNFWNDIKIIIDNEDLLSKIINVTDIMGRRQVVRQLVLVQPSRRFESFRPSQKSP